MEFLYLDEMTSFINNNKGLMASIVFIEALTILYVVCRYFNWDGFWAVLAIFNPISLGVLFMFSAAPILTILIGLGMYSLHKFADWASKKGSQS